MTQNDPLLGQVIADRYQILELLGAGGMGRVYLAEHVRMGRRCAVKVMSPTLALAPDAISRFNREAANASRINHPNVAQIYDFGETQDGTLYLAMELIEGETLTRIVERGGPLPVARAAAITRQIADALGAAHHLGIVHRDLKPENVMVARHLDGSDWVKVVDFGIAKTTQQQGEGSQTVTTAGVSLGTPEYMSPEQLAGERLDQRSDVYALGLVCFHMLTADLPYPRLTSRETLVRRLTARPRTLAEVSPGGHWPAPLQRALDRALAPDAADRYANAVDFSRDVMRAVEVAGEAEKTTVRLEPMRAPTPVASTSGRTRTMPSAEPERGRSVLMPIALALVLLTIAGVVFQRYPGVASRLGARVAALLPARLVTAVDATRALDSAARRIGAFDTSGIVRVANVATMPPRASDSAFTAATSAGPSMPAASPRDSVAQQGAEKAPVPRDSAAHDSTAHDSGAVAVQSGTGSAGQRAPAAVPVAAPGDSTATSMEQLGQHSWLRANGDSGAPRALGPDVPVADRIRAVGEEIEGHIERANQAAGQGEFQRARGDFVAAARELAAVRVVFPSAPAAQQLQRSLAQSVRRAYEDCRNFSADTSSLGGGFRCESLRLWRPNQNAAARFGRQNPNGLP